jgi:hypothetical protein
LFTRFKSSARALPPTVWPGVHDHRVLGLVVALLATRPHAPLPVPVGRDCPWPGSGLAWPTAGGRPLSQLLTVRRGCCGPTVATLLLQTALVCTRVSRSCLPPPSPCVATLCSAPGRAAPPTSHAVTRLLPRSTRVTSAPWLHRRCWLAGRCSHTLRHSLTAHTRFGVGSCMGRADRVLLGRGQTEPEVTQALTHLSLFPCHHGCLSHFL